MWEWSSGPRPVRLRIERSDGNLIATYLDQDKALPVTDFYDWGGGFYFTLIGRSKSGGIKLSKNTGWLIGEGILDYGALKGTTEFYPYGEMLGEPGKAVIQNWAPRLIKP